MRESNAELDRTAAMSHECSGCSDEEPCDSCGGGVRRDSSAYQALSWGVMAAANRPGLDRFWRAPMVGAAVRSAPGRQDSPEWRAIEGVTRNLQLDVDAARADPLSAAARGALARDILMSRGLAPAPDPRPYRGEPDDSDDDLQELPLTEPERRPIDWPMLELRWLGGPACCVSQFRYPSRLGEPKQVVEVLTQGVMAYPKVKRQFDFSMRFDPFPPCDCSCCVFVQFILVDFITWTPNASGSIDPWVAEEFPKTAKESEKPGKEIAPGVPGEDDCSWFLPVKDTAGNPVLDDRGQQVYKERRLPVGSPAPTDESGWIGPFCYGKLKPQNLPGGRGPGIPAGAGGTCIYEDHDTPEMWTHLNVQWHWSWLSVGVIYDTCRLNAQRAIRYLRWEIDGETTGNGVVVVDQTKAAESTHFGDVGASA